MNRHTSVTLQILILDKTTSSIRGDTELNIRLCLRNKDTSRLKSQFLAKNEQILIEDTLSHHAVNFEILRKFYAS